MAKKGRRVTVHAGRKRKRSIPNFYRGKSASLTSTPVQQGPPIDPYTQEMIDLAQQENAQTTKDYSALQTQERWMPMQIPSIVHQTASAMKLTKVPARALAKWILKKTKYSEMSADDLSDFFKSDKGLLEIEKFADGIDQGVGAGMGLMGFFGSLAPMM